MARQIPGRAVDPTTTLEVNTLTVAKITANSSLGTAGQVLTSNSTGGIYWAVGGVLLNVVSGASQSAVAGNHYVLTNASTTTVTLPASPTLGDLVGVTVANGRTDNVIARNGQNINSLAENMTLDGAYAAVQLRFADATRGWVFV